MRNSKLILLIILLLISYFIYKNVSTSVFIHRQDRLNLIFYSSQPKYYSLGISNVSYVIPYSVNIEVIVPGGYGYYRIGALGKLSSLEKRPDIFAKTFSTATFSLVDLYFYPKKSTIYYQDKVGNQLLPDWTDIFFASSNANWLDRLLLFWQFNWNHPNQYKQIDNLPVITTKGKTILDMDTFHQRYQGYFYNNTYRQIKDNVQILYNKNYKTALLLSKIIEGEGIRVVDISQITNYQLPITNCLITQSKNASIVASDLQKYFGCQKEIGKPTVSDIIITLGKLEEDWAVE